MGWVLWVKMQYIWRIKHSPKIVEKEVSHQAIMLLSRHLPILNCFHVIPSFLCMIISLLSVVKNLLTIFGEVVWKIQSRLVQVQEVLHIALIPSKEAQYDIAPCLACDGNRKSATTVMVPHFLLIFLIICRWYCDVHVESCTGVDSYSNSDELFKYSWDLPKR